jgi:hypothetical protein
MSNYLNTAKEHELVFRQILKNLDIGHEDMSIENIYEKYSTGNETGVLTILDFVKKETGDFEFTWENTAPLSGIGRSELWEFEKEGLKFIETISYWMS